jgi:polyketide biosynthesis enoyl-CoA hydratase PksI
VTISDTGVDLHIINARLVEEGILLLEVNDIQNKNTFSSELESDLAACLSYVNRSPSIKVVVITGYDSYFLTGGSREELLELNEGRMVFTDINVYRFSLDCAVPVIAAMQGHAIGGGLVLGLFCDVIFMSAESVYTFNFMKYGFTPGMGATLIAPYKLGNALASEMLFSAARYRGLELKSRGVPFAVVSRKDLLNEAVSHAKKMSSMPRKSLCLLKTHLNNKLKAELEYHIQEELKMHATTIREEYVRDQIISNF